MKNQAFGSRTSGKKAYGRTNWRATGPDTLEFTVSDGTFTSAPALVSIDVQPAPAAAGGGGGGGGSCGSFGFDLLWPLGLLVLWRRRLA